MNKKVTKKQTIDFKYIENIKNVFNSELPNLTNSKLPTIKEIIDFTKLLPKIVFPGFLSSKVVEKNEIDFFIEKIITKIYTKLVNIISKTLYFYEQNNLSDIENKTYTIVEDFISSIPNIITSIKSDLQSAYNGDPAAKNFEEIILAYPGVYSILIHRFAHKLYEHKVPLIPRVMSEYAHRRVGIDIHPGAVIGQGFFIDHGTGVVIGETCVIGNNVKIYQGVTLGALSFPKKKDGTLIKGLKRHPTVENNVTIYSGATILGNITIGANSTIGGNVWITTNIPPNTIVTIAEHKLSIKTKNM